MSIDTQQPAPQGAPAAPRGAWGSRMGFVLASAGSAIGLGNIWKFPYITGENGGGLFVAIYLVCIALVGVPVMTAEIMAGRMAQSSPVPAFDKLGNGKAIWRLVGWMGVVTAFIVLSYYSVVAGWALEYIKGSITQGFTGMDVEQVGGVFGTLYQDVGRNVGWHTLFMVITVAVVAGGVQAGIERGSRIMMPALFVMLGTLLVYSFFSKGFGQAVGFVFSLKADKLHAAGVLEALGHSFFTLSLGMGALITYGSYLDRKTNIPLAAVTVSALDTGISLVACLCMFPVIFAVGLPAKAGPGLVFISMPTAFGQMPGGAALAVMFFVLLFFAALSSAVSMLEIVAATVIDRFGVTRVKATVGTGVLIWLYGLPSANAALMFPGTKTSFFDMMDKVASNYLLPLGGLGVAMLAGWWLSPQQTREQFPEGAKWDAPHATWRFLIRYVVPVSIVLVFLHAVGVV